MNFYISVLHFKAAFNSVLGLFREEAKICGMDYQCVEKPITGSFEQVSAARLKDVSRR